MKRIKAVMLALVVLFTLATVTTACTGGKTCQANKVGNHR